MKEQRIVLPPYAKWSAKFKKTFFERLGGWNSVRNEADMEFAEEIVLVVRDGMYLIEIKWVKDIVEVQKKDLPLGIRKKL